MVGLIAASIFCGAMILAIGLISGSLYYATHLLPDGSADAEVIRSAVSCGFLTYLFSMVPMKVVAYRTAGFRLVLAFFFGVPMVVYYFWTDIGASLSLYVLWAVAALLSYHMLVIYIRRKAQMKKRT